MFKTDRTVYRHKEGIYDLMDEKNINIVSGCCPYKDKTEKLKIWKQLKQQYGDNIRIIIEDHIIKYSCQIDRNFFF
jgi:citrate lyase gamma subunit